MTVEEKLGNAVEMMTKMMEALAERQTRQEEAATEAATNLAKVMEKLVDGKGGEGGGRFRGPGPKGEDDITMSKAFSDIPKNNGKIEEFEPWRFAMTQFLGKDENYVKMLNWIEKEGVMLEPINVQTYAQDNNIDMKWYNSQLWAVLTRNCTGDALKRIMNLESQTETRGTNAWMKTTKDFRCMSAQRFIGLVGRVYNPTRVKKLEDLEMVMETWDSYTMEYQNYTKQDVPEIAKRYSLRQLVPHDVEKDLIKMCTSLGSYYEDCKFVREQIAMQKPAQFGEKKVVKREVGEIESLLARIQEQKRLAVWIKDEENKGEEEDSELDEAEKELYAMKGGGKGKGKFDGNCNHCGKYGHRASNCWQKDKEMAEWRGGGKGAEKGKGFEKGYEKGFKGGGKGYQQKGYGKGNKGGGKTFWFDSVPSEEYGKGGWSYDAKLCNVMETPKSPPGLSRWAPLFKIDEESEVIDEDDEIPLGEYPMLGEKEVTVKTKMPKFQKPKVQKEKLYKCEECNPGIMSVKTLCPLIADIPDRAEAQLHPVTQDQWKYTDPGTGWTRIRAVVDSGASDSCASDDMAPQVKSRESAGSRRGLTYNGAAQGGKPLTNDGEKEMLMVTEEGVKLGTCWQTVEVARPLLSVRQISQQGNRVTFGAYGGEIMNLRSGKIIPFGMEGNVYVIDLWVQPEAGFTRPGR